MLTFWLVIIAIVGYLFGSVNGAIIASNAMFNQDVRDYGSHNAGLTNFHRTYGTTGMAIVFGIDIFKGAIPVLLGKFILGFYGAANVGAVFALLCVVLGHMYPVFHQMRGGKGILTAWGSMLFFDWRLFLIVIIIFLIAVALTRYVSLGSVLAAGFFPIGVVLARHGMLCFIIALVAASFVIFKHRGNIVRLLNHTESKLEFKKDISDKFDETF
ncbi:MAG: glycerol-3-phosphate 1-O-acyltransferase PlsY [Oscillospiraceae bacterium]|nr:glycerol-3-phosphate 1-O-acyltransferase PlsY [Oscillospiraceae bacterium]